jgi:hypothetical protein
MIPANREPNGNRDRYRLSMDNESMQLPTISPLEAPELWADWASRLDASTWVLYATALINSFDPFALARDELLLVSALIDRRAEILANLAAYAVAGQIH